MQFSLLGLVLACGCNVVYGIDETVLVNSNPRTLAFDNRTGKTDLVDIPIAVLLDRTRIDYTQVADPRTGLRFHDPVTDADLPFEVEVWDPAGESVVWVRVPRIAAGSSTDRIEMYFGDQAGTATAGSVWTDFQLVVHGVPGVYQHAAAALKPVAVGVASVPGAIGPAVQLADTGDHYIRYDESSALFAQWTEYTVELWLYADYASSLVLGGEPYIIDQAGSMPGGRLFQQPAVAEYVTMQIDFKYAGSLDSYVPTFVPLREWVHMLFTFDGKLLWIYRNGALSEIDVISTTTVAARPPTADLMLGDAGGGLRGMIDEVRISNRYRSGDWVDAQYRAMRGSFVSFPRPGELL